MSEETAVLEIDEPYFIVKLYKNLLKIEVKGNVKNEIEEALENKPVLKETIGHILNVFVPLHIPLRNIDSVRIENKGKVRIHLPRHRDIVIPVGPKNAVKLEEELHKLVEKEKARELKHTLMQVKSERVAEREKEVEGSSLGGASGWFPIPPDEDLIEEEKENEKEKEEEEEREED
jgi:hypothetical protein